MTFSPFPYNFMLGLQSWAIATACFVGGIFLIGLLLAIATGSVRTYLRVLGTGIRDLVFLAPGRIWAIAQLTIRESIRRKALLVFVVFGLLFMFGGWFISGKTEQRPDLQVKVHVSFVLTTISWLTAPVVLLLACWGIPQDIKTRSLHTVVTKPARRSEVFIGRFLGFSAIGTLILAVMGAAGYLWLQRQVAPDVKDKYLVSKVPVYGGLRFLDQYGDPADRGINVGDIWEFRSYIRGATKAAAIWDFPDVTPDLMVKNEDGEDVLMLESHFESFRTHKGRIDRMLLCQFSILKDIRQQFVATLSFISDFKPLAARITEGDFAAASEQFAKLANGLRQKPTPGVDITPIDFLGLSRAQAYAYFLFRTFPADSGFTGAEAISQAALAASDACVEADSEALADAFETYAKLFETHEQELKEHVVDLEVKLAPFSSPEFHEHTTGIKRKQRIVDNETQQSREVDIFEDMTHGGRLRIAAQCLDSGQLLGMGQPDLFIRTPDRPFASGYVKALGGLWLMLVLIVLLGVTASCFVKGPVATLLTVTVIFVGLFFHPFLQELVIQKPDGFGTFESAWRILAHKNPSTALEDSRATDFMKHADKFIQGGLWGVYQGIPNFGVYSLSPYVANGFDVPWNAALLPCLGVTLAYILPCLIIGYFSLRFRELEAK